MKKQLGNDSIQCEKILLEKLKENKENNENSVDDEKMQNQKHENKSNNNNNNINNSNNNNNENKIMKKTQKISKIKIDSTKFINNYNEYFNKIETFLEGEIQQLAKFKNFVNEFKKKIAKDNEIKKKEISEIEENENNNNNISKDFNKNKNKFLENKLNFGEESLGK